MAVVDPGSCGCGDTLLTHPRAAIHRAEDSSDSSRFIDLKPSQSARRRSEISAEAYEVYSDLYQQPPQEPLAFVEESKTDIPQVNGSCLKPSTPQEHEMTDALVAENRQSHNWEKKFTITAGYLLLPGSEIAKVQDCIASSVKSATACQVYGSLRHLRYLGVPGFDRTHTRALVSVMKVCGNQCGSGGIFEVEKAGNTWKRSETTNFFSDCSWMY